MKLTPFRIAAVALFLFSGLAQAQDDPPPVNSRALSATVNYGNDADGNPLTFQPAKSGIDFAQLGVRPGQSVAITVTFPVELAGQLIIVEPLDGGIATIPDDGLHVAEDGTITFPFQGGDNVGACRITVHQPDDMNVIHFLVIDAEHPENNPADLPGAY